MNVAYPVLWDLAAGWKAISVILHSPHGNVWDQIIPTVPEIASIPVNQSRFYMRWKRISLFSAIMCYPQCDSNYHNGDITPDRTQVGPMLAPWTLLSGTVLNWAITMLFEVHFSLNMIFDYNFCARTLISHVVKFQRYTTYIFQY